MLKNPASVALTTVNNVFYKFWINFISLPWLGDKNWLPPSCPVSNGLNVCVPKPLWGDWGFDPGLYDVVGKVEKSEPHVDSVLMLGCSNNDESGRRPYGLGVLWLAENILEPAMLDRKSAVVFDTSYNIAKFWYQPIKKSVINKLIC